MAFPGNCMMAWGVLRALGVPESLKGEIEAAWRKMPEAYEVSFKLTAEEYDALKKRIGGENPSEANGLPVGGELELAECNMRGAARSYVKSDAERPSTGSCVMGL